MCSNEETRTPKEYTPIPYTFRLPNDTKISPSGKGTAICPPFYVQLDHTLAVIWSLFSEQPTNKPLGVVQIQWALSFLKRITNSRKEHPADILVCIEAMQEALIKQYADMADSVLSVMPIESVSEPVVEATKSIDSEHIPFSVNYVDMMRYRDTPSERTLRPNESPTQFNEKIKSLTGTPGANIQSKDEMVAFLKDFRKEQITKVCDELKRLQSIEAYLGSMDRCSFKPYLDNQDLSIFKDCDCKK